MLHKEMGVTPVTRCSECGLHPKKGKDKAEQNAESSGPNTMEMDACLPVIREPVDALKDGFKSLAIEAAAPHPVQAFQTMRKEGEFRARLQTISRIYGMAAAMRLKTEKELLSQYRRPPGMPSSMVGLETVLGDDETVEFEDFLGDPMEKPDIKPVLVHDKMEARLGL